MLIFVVDSFAWEEGFRKGDRRVWGGGRGAWGGRIGRVVRE